MSEKKRIVYIDYLKGLTILWVVWFHTPHPSFVGYSFRLPLFFFVSGIFFKAYPFTEFVKKKVNTLVVPFIFFYFLYYAWMIWMHTMKGGTLESFPYDCIFQIFEPHKATQTFYVDPPLWFICALIILQFMLYGLVKVVRRDWLLLLIATAVSAVGVLYFYQRETYFMFGRCLQYFVYYVAGFVMGKELINILEGERGKRLPWLLMITSFLVFVGLALLKDVWPSLSDTKGVTYYIGTALSYIEIFATIIFCVYVIKYLSVLPILKPLKYFGTNSYIVLGTHEMILTMMKISYKHFFGKPGVWGGLVILAATIVLLVPVIWLLNKSCPVLVGKNKLWK